MSKVGTMIAIYPVTITGDALMALKIRMKSRDWDFWTPLLLGDVTSDTIDLELTRVQSLIDNVADDPDGNESFPIRDPPKRRDRPEPCRNPVFHHAGVPKPVHSDVRRFPDYHAF